MEKVVNCEKKVHEGNPILSHVNRKAAKRSLRAVIYVTLAIIRDI